MVAGEGNGEGNGEADEEANEEVVDGLGEREDALCLRKSRLVSASATFSACFRRVRCGPRSRVCLVFRDNVQLPLTRVA